MVIVCLCPCPVHTFQNKLKHWYESNTSPVKNLLRSCCWFDKHYNGTNEENKNIEKTNLFRHFPLVQMQLGEVAWLLKTIFSLAELETQFWRVTAGYFYDTFAYEICFYGIYFYGIYIYGIYFYRALKFISINCTVSVY